MDGLCFIYGLYSSHRKNQLDSAFLGDYPLGSITEEPTMNYTNLSTKELIHYAQLDAKTDLEKALVAKFSSIIDENESLESENKSLQREISNAPDLSDIRGRISTIRSDLAELEDELS
jgi:hypothetical protein